MPSCEPSGPLDPMLPNAGDGLISILQAALREAITNAVRVRRTRVKFDSAGEDWSMDWTPDVKRWAALCGLDLDLLYMESYDRH
mgnify:CR=1 FL=1